MSVSVPLNRPNFIGNLRNIDSIIIEMIYHPVHGVVAMAVQSRTVTS